MIANDEVSLTAGRAACFLRSCGCANVLISVSVIPSLRYSVSGSPLTFSNGRMSPPKFFLQRPAAPWPSHRARHTLRVGRPALTSVHGLPQTFPSIFGISRLGHPSCSRRSQLHNLRSSEFSGKRPGVVYSLSTKDELARNPSIPNLEHTLSCFLQWIGVSSAALIVA